MEAHEFWNSQRLQNGFCTREEEFRSFDIEIYRKSALSHLRDTGLDLCSKNPHF